MKLTEEKILDVITNIGIKKNIDFDLIAEWFLEKEKISFADPKDYFDERHTHTVGLNPENNPIPQGQYVLRYETFYCECGISQSYARRIVKGLIDNKLFYSYPSNGYIRGILIDFTKTIDDFVEEESNDYLIDEDDSKYERRKY